MTQTIKYRAQLLIEGELVRDPEAESIDAINPTTGAVIGDFPETTPAEIDRAVEAAIRASTGWRDLAWTTRAAALRKVADTLDEHREELAQLDVADCGLPITSARADVESAAQTIRYYAGIAGETKGQTIPSGPGSLTFTEFVPYPVVAKIVPFNHPAKFAAGGSAPALAAGCPVILKPGEHTSLSALRLGELLREILPAGVFNVVTGRGASVGAALAGHPDIPRVAFTGSVPTGQRIGAAGAEHIKHVTLELGGKNPFIVYPDADPVAAAKGAVAAMNFARSMGQSCGSTSRAFVHEDIHEAFCTALIGEVAALRVGDPADPSTQMGPLAFEGHYRKVLDMIATGIREGAELLHPRTRTERDGFFVDPTVFDRVDPSMTIARQEIFGPVLSVFTWQDEATMIDLANSVEYGLTGNVWTNDISTAIRLMRSLDVGYVSVNGTGRRPVGAPFGGFKHSGIGKENSLEDLLSFGQLKSATITLR